MEWREGRESEDIVMIDASYDSALVKADTVSSAMREILTLVPWHDPR